MRTKVLFLLIFSLGLFIFSCQSSSEPTTENTFVYEPSRSEVVLQTEAIVTEILSQTTNIFAGYKNIDRTLGKTSSNRTYHYFGDWHIWKGEIEESPFDIPNAYQADYTAQIQFLKNQNNPVKFPDNANGLKWKYNAHAQFGFVNNEAPGDEVWYDIDGHASPLSGYPTMLNMAGTYERRWAGIYNDEEANFHHAWDVLVNNIKFYYSGDKNDYWLKGTVKVKVGQFNSDIIFNNSRTAKINVYKNGNKEQSYEKEFPNFYEIYNLPSLENWEMSLNFEFPAPIPL